MSVLRASDVPMASKLVSDGGNDEIGNTTDCVWRRMLLSARISADSTTRVIARTTVSATFDKNSPTLDTTLQLPLYTANEPYAAATFVTCSVSMRERR